MSYHSKEWAALRRYVLDRDGVCQMCGCLLREGRSDKQAGSIRPFVADHIVPHRGVAALFTAKENVWAVCCDCHDGACQAIETRYRNQPLKRVARTIREEKLNHRIVGLDGYRKSPPDRAVQGLSGWDELLGNIPGGV